MKHYKGVYLIICSLFFLFFLFNACSIHKRRYSKGFYINSRVFSKTSLNRISNWPDNSIVNADTSEICKELYIYNHTSSFEMIDNAALHDDKTDIREENQLKLTRDTISKKQEKNTDKTNGQDTKPRIEQFSKLALIAMIINFILVVTLLILILFFTVPEVIVPLLLPLGFLPAIPLLLALEGKFRNKKNPEKYKWPRMADLVIFVSIWLFILSLFYLAIFIFKETFG